MPHKIKAIVKKILRLFFKRNFNTQCSLEENNTFISEERIYLASADQFKGMEHLVERDELWECCIFYSVIGGLGGLNILARLEQVKKMVFFDINPHMLPLCNLMFSIIKESESREDFISMVYCREFSERQYNEQNQRFFYMQPICHDIKNKLKSFLSPEEFNTYENFYFPYIRESQQDFVMGPSLHCTSLKVFHSAPMSGVMTYPFLDRETVLNQTIISTNSFFYGKGWLKNEERFHKVKKYLENLPYEIIISDISSLCPEAGAGLYATNVLEGNELYFQSLQSKFEWIIWYDAESKYLKANYALSNKETMPYQKIYSSINKNPHEDCCNLLKEQFDIDNVSFLEVIVPSATEGMDSGFRFFDRQRKVHANTFLREIDIPVDVNMIILHIIMGNGYSFSGWKKIIEKAISFNHQVSVCVFEHNPLSLDWPEKDVYSWNIPPVIMLERELLALKNDWCKFATGSIKEEGIRNIVWFTPIQEK